MKRILLAFLLLVAIDASATVRRLGTDCILPTATPTEAQPFDLDACTLTEA